MVQNSKEYMTNYYQNNKDRYAKYNYTMQCECCQTVMPRNYWHRHIKTAKHKANLQKHTVAETTVSQETKQKLDKYKSKAKDYMERIRLLERDLGYSSTKAVKT